MLEFQSTNSSEKAGYLVDQATCYHEIGSLSETGVCIAKAKELVSDDPLGLAQIEYCRCRRDSPTSSARKTSNRSAHSDNTR